MKRLKVGLLGLTGAGTEYLAALQSSERFDLIAVADNDVNVLRRCADPAIPHRYEDYRSVIVEAPQTGLELLFIALEPFQSVEYGELAAERGIGVFHKVPWARSFREAQAIVRRFSERDCPFVVPRPWQCEPHGTLLRNIRARLGPIHLANAELRTTCPPTGWRGDSVRAGGGVLLNEAYGLVDLLVHVLGVPDRVYTRCSDAAAAGTVRNYDTEDAAIVTLGFTGTCVGCLSVWRTSGAPQWRLALVGRDGSADLSEADGRIERSDGETGIQGIDWSEARAIEAFDAGPCDGEPGMVATAADHLATMGVIEAAYLSERTGTPESPGQFLD